jgi:hypothetical protein
VRTAAPAPPLAELARSVAVGGCPADP